MAKRKRTFTVGGGLWGIFFVLPLLLGLLLKMVFDGISDGRSAQYFVVVIGAYALVEFVRRLVVHKGSVVWVRFWSMAELLLRGGMLRAQVASGGRHAGQPVDHAGAAMTRFRDDPNDVAMYIDSWIDVAGASAFGLTAILVMASIDVLLTVFVLLPVAAIALTTRALGHWVTTVHRRHLERTSRLTAALRDVFAAHNTIRLYDAREGATAEVAERAAERSKAAVADTILTESIRSTSMSLTEVAVGVMLLVIASDLRSGAFSVGDLALFTSYLGYLTFLPRMTGHFMTRHRQADVAFARMGQLAARGQAENLLENFDLGIDGGNPMPARAPSPRDPLESLVVRDLSFTFDNGKGIARADFELEPGTLTVVTGPVGAGKTTLVRALLGLVPADGTTLWNGYSVDDAAAFMIPPHVAYLPQTPHLLSDTLQANVRLGHAGSDLGATLALAGLTEEVAAMTKGPETLVGPRGVRLSGGQRQRLGLARALHQRPELLVLDDLSSAVDVETELELWHGLRAAAATILAVSNRPIAINAADQVISVEDGQVAARREPSSDPALSGG